MDTRVAWVLNLDADVELARAIEGAPPYTPTRAVREAMRPHVARLAASLLAASLMADDDLLVDEDALPGAARGLTGRAYCPTPRALALLRRAGAEPERHPAVDVLRAVNSRAFAASLGQTLPGAAFVTEWDEARALLREPPAIGDGWRVKRAFGMAGRGQRIVDPGEASDAELAFVRAGLAEGGVQIEPNVGVVEEYAMHGMLDERGGLRVGALVRQVCDRRGQWLASERLAADDHGVGARLEEEVRRVGVALARAGYFGPFGVDAYTYEGAGGELAWQARSEINARYSMGFAVGVNHGA